MAATTGDLDRLSGVALPRILQEKLKAQQKLLGEETSESKTSKDDSQILDDARANSIFTAQELEERIWKTRVAIADIQKQLMRGEESYHEDTHSHGNLYRGGFDVFIDAKVDSIGVPLGTTSSRRMPADNRWFSSSCTSAGRSPRPMPVARNFAALVASQSKAPPTAASAATNSATPANFAAAGASSSNQNESEGTVNSLPQGVPGALSTAGVGAATSSIPAGSTASDPSNVEGELIASASEPAVSTTGTLDAGGGRRTRKRKASDA